MLMIKFHDITFCLVPWPVDGLVGCKGFDPFVYIHLILGSLVLPLCLFVSPGANYLKIVCNSFESYQAYGQSKVGEILLARMIGQQLKVSFSP